MSKKSTAIDSEYLIKLNQLATLFGMNNQSFLHAMIDYFEYYKINPLERNENLDTKLSKMQVDLEKKIANVKDTFVSFQRTLEQKKLEPLIKQVNESTHALLVFLKEDALTKEDLKSLSSGGGYRRVAALETKQPIVGEKNENQIIISEPLDDIGRYKLSANESLKNYKTYFTEMIKSISRTNDKGDYIYVSAINEFKENVKAIPKVNFEGEKTNDTYDTIERVETILRTVDNYCDEFLSKGETAAGKDKFFFSHTINEYRLKFDNIKIQ